MNHARSLALALTLVPAALAAPQEAGWEIDYIESQSSAVFPERVVATPDGGAVFLSLAHDLPLPNPSYGGFDDTDLRVLVQKYDENGDREWIRVFDGRTRVHIMDFAGPFLDVELDPGGDLFVLVPTMTPSAQGVEAQIHRLAIDGTTVWTHDIVAPAGTLNFRVVDVEASPSGGVIAAGTHYDNSYPRLDVRSIDAAGQQVWEWRGQGPGGGSYTYTGDVYGIVVAPDGTTYVHGADDAFPFEFFPVVWAIDAAGQFLWARSIACGSGDEGAVLRAAVEPSGNVALLSYSIADPWILVSGLTPQGNLSFCTPFSGLDASDIAVDEVGRKFLAGSSNNEMALIRLDAAGSLLGVTRASAADATPAWSRPGRVALTPDGVAMIGFDFEPNAGVVVAHFDRLGVERWSVTRGGHGVPVAPTMPDVGAEARGNIVGTSLDLRGGNGLNRRFSVDLFRLVDGGAVGSSYCGPAVPNSTGVPATLRALGSDDVQVDNLTLRVDDLPPGAFTLLLASRTQGSMPGVGGGQGTLCLGGSIGRYVGPGQIRRASPHGIAALQLDLVALPQPTGFVSAAVGETWNFQAWYRDANPTLTSNLSNGASVLIR